MEMDERKKKKKKRSQISCRAPIKGQLEAIDLPRMNVQISPAMEGDRIILTLRHPRDVLRRLSFKENVNLLVGFCIFVSVIFFPTIQKEILNQDQRMYMIFALFCGSLGYISLIELLQFIPRRLTQEQQRLARLVGWFQEALIIIVLVTMVYWILRAPVVP